MRSISTNIYTFDELTENNKKNALDMARVSTWFYNIQMDAFMDNQSVALSELFKNSKPLIECDFGCVQGSGLNIFGTFSIADLIDMADVDQELYADFIKFIMNTTLLLALLRTETARILYGIQTTKHNCFSVS